MVSGMEKEMGKRHQLICPILAAAILALISIFSCVDMPDPGGNMPDSGPIPQSGDTSAHYAAFVATTDYVKALPETIAKWLPGPLVSLGTDGFGRSDGRRHLRDFFEVDERYITLAALYGLARQGQLDSDQVSKAMDALGIDPNKPNPVVS